MKKLKIVLLILLILEIAYFFYAETNDIVITTQEINDTTLKEALGGIKIVQISDLHIGKVGVREKRLINLINKINPDIIFVTGDFISKNEGIRPCLEVLKYLVKDRTIIAILGNSDHSYKNKSINTQVLVKELERMGIKVLINESIKLMVEERTNQSLYIVGLNDNYLWLDDIFKATNNVPPNSPKILLAHSPHIIEKINTKGINLILSGHTHGGQVVLPFIGAIYTNKGGTAKKRFVSGLYNEETKLYVNQGIGTSVIPFRLFCKPEITLFKFN